MSSACGAAGYIIEVVDTFDFEGYLAVLFYEGEVSSVIGYFWKINYFAVV